MASDSLAWRWSAALTETATAAEPVTVSDVLFQLLSPLPPSGEPKERDV